MNQPRLLSRLMGSLPVYLLLMVITLALGYHWWMNIDTVSGWVPIIALLLGTSATNARTQVTRYKDWKRAWDSMEGRRDGPVRYGTKAVILLIPGAALAYWLSLHPPGAPQSTPTDAAVLWLFLVLTAIWLYQAAQWWRHRPQTARTKSRREHVATVCLPVPKDGKLQLQDVLPAYCQPLLGKHR